MDITRSSCSVHFHVPGVPVGKGRPRFTKAGHTYTPAKTKAWEKTVAKAAWWAMHGRIADEHQLLEGPLKVMLVFYIPIPRSWSKRRKKEAVGQPHVFKPDLSNLVKAVEDGMAGIVFSDDSQVAVLSASKRYALDDPWVGVGVTVEELT